MERRTFLTALTGLTLTACSKSAAQNTSSQDTLKNQMVAARLDAIPFERISLDGSKHVKQWEQLRQSRKGWPLLIGSDDDLQMIGEGLIIARDDKADAEEILRSAAKITHPDDMFARIKKEYGAVSEPLPTPPQGSWPPNPASQPNLAPIFVDMDGKSLPIVHALIIPVADFTTIPAHLFWGGWNANPAPAEHVAALRSWKERYGAELVSLRKDVMELRVKQRPNTVEEAMALAKEHYYYCSDIVEQGVGTLSALADILLKSDWWYFWWD